MNSATERNSPVSVQAEAVTIDENFTAIPDDYLREMSVLSDAEYGRLIRAVQQYNCTGEPMGLDGNERFYMMRCMRENDRYKEYFRSQAEAREKRAQINRINGAKGGKAKANRKRSSNRQATAKQSLSDATTNPSEAKQSLSNRQATAKQSLSEATIDNYHIPDTYTTTDTQSITGTCREEENVHSSNSSLPKNTSGNKQNSSSFCSELPLTRATEQEPTPAGGLPGIVLNTGELYFVTTDDVKNWESLYPAVDIAQEIRNMAGWCDANPKKRKTRAGIKRFINSWLSRAQNHGGGNSSYAGGSNGDDEFSKYFAQQDSIERAQLDAIDWDRFGGPEAHTV